MLCYVVETDRFGLAQGSVALRPVGWLDVIPHDYEVGPTKT